MRTRAAHSASGSTHSVSENKAVKRCKDSTAVASPLRQRRSSVVQSPEASPVLKRKSVFSNVRPIASKNNPRDKTDVFARPVSPVLGRRKHPLGVSSACNAITSPRHHSKLGNSEQEFPQGKQLSVSHLTLLCDRKNILSSSAVQENAKKPGHTKFPMEMANLDKENIAEIPVRKSGRSKKLTEKYVDFTKKSSQVEESVLSSQLATTQNKKRCLRSTENIASDTAEKGRLKQTKIDLTGVVGHGKNPPSSDKDSDVQLENSKHKSPVSSTDNNLQPHGNDENKDSEESLGNKKKSKGVAASVKKSPITRDLASLRVTRTRVAAQRKGESELDVQSTSLKSSTASADESLHTSVASGELCSVTSRKSSPNTKELTTEEENMSVGTRRKAKRAVKTNVKAYSATSRICRTDATVKASPKSCRESSRTTRISGKSTPKTFPATSRKRTKLPMTAAQKCSNTSRTMKESLKISPSSSKSLKISPSSSKSLKISPSSSKSLKISPSSSRSLKKAVSRKSSPKESAKDASRLSKGAETENAVISKMPVPDCQNGNNLAVKKPPVWASERRMSKSPRVGIRRSIRGKSDIFEFPVSPVKENNQKKRRQCKPRVRKKASKPKPTLKTTLLITDPSWQDPIDITSRVRTIESVNQGSVRSASSENNATGCESSRSIASEYNFDDDFDIHESEDFEACHQEDRIYSRGDENVLEEFPGETASSFVSMQNTASSEPMVSASALPTPAILKHMSKHLGSSTPRVENATFTILAKEPADVKEDIALCFGFEDSNDSTTGEEDTVSCISPVRQSGLNSHLSITYASDMLDNSNQTSSQPYRFSWGSLRAGCRSHASSRSSSMVAQGQSLNSSTQSSVSSVSQNVQLNGNTSNKKDTSINFVTKRDKQRAKKPVKNCGSRSNHDVSVLFDEEPLDVGTSSNTVQKTQDMGSFNTLDQYLAQNSVHQSPDKSFQQPARRSYDKRALEEARKKFIKECGGIVTTEAETEEDISVQKEPVKRKKTINRKRTAKKKKPEHDSTTDVSQSTDDSTAEDALDKKKHKTIKKKKKADKLEKSLNDWASDLNTHFSEIEDCELVVM